MFYLRMLRKINVYLYTSAIIANILSFTVGCYFAWTSPAIPKLKGLTNPDDNPLDHPITPYEESWIASLLPLGAAASTFVSGYFSDKIGRKFTLALSSVVTIVALVLSIFANHVTHFYLARVLCGLGVGTVFTVIPIYIGEISENENRGILGCLMVLAITIGIVFTYIVGPAVPLKMFSYINLGIILAFLFLFLVFVPESPYFLIEKNKHEKAYQSLKYLRRNKGDEEIRNELMNITKDVEESFRTPFQIRDLWQEKPLFKAICITCSLVTFQQLSGVNVILFFMQSIFEETGSSLPSTTSVVIISIVQVLVCLVTSIFVDRFGRKIFLFISCVGTAISLTSFGAFFYLKQIGEDTSSIYWLPIISIILFMVAYALGLGPIPFIVLSEVFPPNAKGPAATITIFTCLAFTFCTTTFFPHLVVIAGMAYIFWLLAVFCSVGAMFVYVHLPETRGKGLQEIQEILKR